MSRSRRRREAAAAEERRLDEQQRDRRVARYALIGAVVAALVIAAVTGGAGKAWQWLFPEDPIAVNGSRAADESYPYWGDDNPGFTAFSDPDRHDPGCSIVSVVPQDRTQIQPPGIDGRNQGAEVSEWVRRYHAADPDRTMYAFSVTARNQAVTLQGARAVIVRRTDAPASATLVQLQVGPGCGAGGTRQEFELDLDDPDGHLTTSSAETTGFPYVVDKEAAISFQVVANTESCDCVWYLELKWIAGDKKGTTCVMDGSFVCPESMDEADRAFHTAPSTGLPSVAWALSGPDKMSPPWRSATFDWAPPRVSGG